MADNILTYFSHFLNRPFKSGENFLFKQKAWEPSFCYGPRFSIAHFSSNAVWKERPGSMSGLGSRPEMDIDLPGMNGITTTKIIRRTPNANQNILIIGLSTHDESQLKNSALIAGMNGYIEKPLTFEKAQEILAMII